MSKESVITLMGLQFLLDFIFRFLGASLLLSLFTALRCLNYYSDNFYFGEAFAAH